MPVSGSSQPRWGVRQPAADGDVAGLLDLDVKQLARPLLFMADRRHSGPVEVHQPGTAGTHDQAVACASH
jgi:hypothetical protein